MKSIYTFLLIGALQTNGIAQCPSITKQPVSQTDCESNSIRMIIETNASTVQWERKRPSDANFSSISGATTTNYQIIPTGGTTAPDGTKYRAKLQTGACVVYSEEASIYLSNITNITGTTICERSNGELVANLSQGGQNQAIAYQWSTSINGGAYQDISNGTSFDGANSARLIIKNVSLQNQSQKFKVKVEFRISPDNDNEGSLVNQNQTPSCPRTSAEVSLTVKSSPTPTHSVTAYSACAGINTTVSSTGCSPYTTIWYNEQQVKVGEGARPTLLFPQASLQHLKATCMKSGCESLPSNGVQVTVNPIPEKVENNGTPSNVDLGNDITFKATGGINNIWYLNETDNSPISTASTITIKNVQSAGFISRWVSQRINGCESPKTEIRVLVESNLIPFAPPVSIQDTIHHPIFTPEPDRLVEEPVISEPEIFEEPTIQDPEPISIPEPINQPVVIQFEKVCQRSAYKLSSTNCPANVDYFDGDSFTYLGTSEPNQFFEFNASFDRKIIALCRAPYFEEIQLEFSNLKNPEISVAIDKTSFCEGDSMEMNSENRFEGIFLHWEKNGHMYSQEKTLKTKADASLFEAVYWHNDCIFRAAAPFITVHPKPLKPSYKYTKKRFCKEESIDLIGEEYVKTYHWSNGEKTKKIQINQPLTLSLQVENEFGCISEPSDSVSFTLLPEGKKPSILASQIQFCEGDSIVLVSDLGNGTIWQNGIQTEQIIVTETSEWVARSKSPFGCWSEPSNPVQVIKRERPAVPQIELPFNRIIRGIKKVASDSLHWKINGEINLSQDEIILKQPSQVELQAVKWYELNHHPSIACNSKPNLQFISNIEPLGDMEVFPNPSLGNQLFINTPVEIIDGQLYLVDLKGEIVHQENVSNKQNPMKLLLDRVNPGVYFLQIQTKNWQGIKRVLLL